MRVPRRHLNPFPGDRSVVVLDNAAVHWDDRVRRLIERKGAILLYLPAYSYDFNPIEMAFNEAKATLERLHGTDRAYLEDMPEEALRQALLSIDSENAAAYMRHCGWRATPFLPGLLDEVYM